MVYRHFDISMLSLRILWKILLNTVHLILNMSGNYLELGEIICFINLDKGNHISLWPGCSAKEEA